MKKTTFFLCFLFLLSACNPYLPATPEAVSPTDTAQPAPLRTRPAATATGTAEPQTAIVKAAVINVRQSPDGEVIATLNAGNKVQIVQCRGNWCQINEPVEGWVFKGCLSVKSGLGCTAK